MEKTNPTTRVVGFEEDGRAGTVKKIVWKMGRGMWETRMQKKPALEIYKARKTDIRNEGIFDNPRGSAFYFYARTDVLRARTYRAKFQEVDTIYAVCGEGVEMPEHVIMVCGGSVTQVHHAGKLTSSGL